MPDPFPNFDHLSKITHNHPILSRQAQANMPLTPNIFAQIPQHLPEELFETLLISPNLKIERIISHGHNSAPDDWYDQEQSEWVLVLQGAARLQLEDGYINLTAGDYLNIPAHQKHRVDWTTPETATIWLAIFY